MADHDNFPDFNGDEEIGSKKDQKVESAKGERGEVREENERLKFLLGQLVNDYQSLQMKLQQTKEDTKTTHHHEENEESELVCLSLGISSTSQGQHRMDMKKNNSNTTTEKRENEEEEEDKGLALGLDMIRFDPAAAVVSDQIEAANNLSPESSLDGKGKEAEEPTEMWPPSKVLKTIKIGDKSEVSQHSTTQLKKAARVSIRARCDSQTMNDGCQWRKYGQKIAKGNPCPRAYYRCTVSPSCPVRKQVQRCAEDMSILITTYEGIHNHPLPLSATAMASTTCAAASMLQSPSLMSSQQGITNSDNIINSSAAHTPNALNFSTYQISRPHPLIHLPNSCISTLNSHPTITLDLTASPTPTHSGNFTSGFSYTPKYSSTNLNFSTSSSSGFCPLQSSMPQSPWSSYSGSYFNSGTATLAQIRNQGGHTYMLNTGKQPSQGVIHNSNYMSNHSISQQSLPDSIVAATKAITTNPKFQSALVNALTTYVGNGGGGSSTSNSLIENHHVVESAAALKLKENISNQNNRGTCSPSSSGYLMNMSSSALNSQQGNLINAFSPPPPPAVSKSASGSSSNRSS